MDDDGKTDYTKLNQDHFDNEAVSYDAKHARATEEIARRIEARRDFIGLDWVEDDDDSSEDEGDDGGGGDDDRKPSRAVKILDYACGTGSMSRALAPYITQSIGIDLSEKMVAAYNVRARNQGLTQDEMAAYHGNLCTPGDDDPPAFRGPRFTGFDLAVVGLGFHHFDDPELAARRLVARLRPGGVLMIIDFLPHAAVPHGGGGGGGADDSSGAGHGHGLDHEHGHHNHHHDANNGQMEEVDGDDAVDKSLRTVTHHGFSEEHIRDIFVGAGAGRDFALDDMGQVVMGSRHGRRTLFMARGTKA